MHSVAPPPKVPAIALDEKPGGRMHLRMRQLSYTAITVFLTAWFCTMGVIPAILALVVAKHVLVAILALGLDADRSAAPSA
ncbi:MAG TPA: hypothetical protein VGZ47_03170 [Gemmataceae bacterium]|nr:hypothetical protein [Gemmataceae bacterium]